MRHAAIPLNRHPGSTPDTPVAKAPDNSSITFLQAGNSRARLAPAITLLPWPAEADEPTQVDWLILHFNHWFAHHHVILQRGDDEPEYFPAAADEQGQPQPARIVFAHGYFASALHEISHWCVAGAQRRLLPDLGYWYAPDGRNAEQQALFEQVEVKPQALEWLFTRACQRTFRVSLDNLNGEAGSGEQFKNHVHARVQDLLRGHAPIPQDAQRFIAGLSTAIRQGQLLQATEFQRQHL